MRAWTALSAMVLIACTALGGFVWSRAPQPTPAEPSPRTGMELLQAYRCGSGETKRVILRGVEDNFSVAGDEPMRVREDRRTARMLSLRMGVSFDETAPDYWLVDYLETPTRISRGLFVIGLKPVAEAGNDLLSIGDSFSSGEKELFTTRIVDLRRRPGWGRLGKIHHAEFDQIRLNGGDSELGARARPGSPETLLASVRGRDDPARIDVSVQDDTSVDFMGIAVCEQPPAGMGVTYSLNPHRPGGDYYGLACWSTPEGEYICQPTRGDTPCATPLQVACFRNREQPVPADLPRMTPWSGGDLAYTEPVPASRFRTIAEADDFCRTRFGRGWRTATFHDGLVGGHLFTRGDRAALKSRRVWVDIQDQPYGTCWARR